MLPTFLRARGALFDGRVVAAFERPEALASATALLAFEQLTRHCAAGV